MTIPSAQIGRIDSLEVLNLAYPSVCQLCRSGVPCAENGYVCSAYQSRLFPVRPPICGHCGIHVDGVTPDLFLCENCANPMWKFNFALSGWAAAGGLRDVIHQYKYEGGIWFEGLVAGLFERRFVEELGMGEWEAVVPVPLHPRQQRERGFNQAEVLAKRLGKVTGLAVLADLVKRVRDTDTQSSLSRRERLKNVQDAFGPTRTSPEVPARVLLVDDVMTTGATASACAEALRRLGVERIGVLTLARAGLVPEN